MTKHLPSILIGAIVGLIVGLATAIAAMYFEEEVSMIQYTIDNLEAMEIIK